MGRSLDGKAPFRVILNQSLAIATNVYLMLYPRRPLRRQMVSASAYQKALATLSQIVDAEWRANGRVYGGGLYKVEPRELGRLAAGSLLEAFPGLTTEVADQMQLRLGAR